MRRIRVAALAFALVGGASFGAADAADVSEENGVVIVRGHAPYPVHYPPIGHVLDPSDARRPIYVVNQGPVYDGPGIFTYAVPTYSEGGYAYGYPYVYGYYSYRYGHPIYEYRRPAYRGGAYYRHPAGSYRYRPAPSAHVIKVGDDKGPGATPRARPATPGRTAPATPVPPPARGDVPHTR